MVFIEIHIYFMNWLLYIFVQYFTWISYREGQHYLWYSWEPVITFIKLSTSSYKYCSYCWLYCGRYTGKLLYKKTEIRKSKQIYGNGETMVSPLPSPLAGAALVVVRGLACPKYLESYARGGFNLCSPLLWGERVSHASKICQGRARLNGSHELGCQYGSTVSPARRAALYGAPCVGWLCV